MTITLTKQNLTLAEFIANPPENKEWVDGNLVKKIATTIRHSKIQSRLVRLWGNYLQESGLGGEAYVEFPCVTLGRGRRPDVCYLTPELVAQFENAATLPQSPPLIAEIVSPTDAAEDLFAKATEYLESGCGEVWLVFPESNRLFILTQAQTLAFHKFDEVRTQSVLLGFHILLNELFE